MRPPNNFLNWLPSFDREKLCVDLHTVLTFFFNQIFLTLRMCKNHSLCLFVVQQFYLQQKVHSTKFDMNMWLPHCVKSVHIRRYSVPYFPAFGMNMDGYRVPMDQNNFEYGHFSCSVSSLLLHETWIQM